MTVASTAKRRRRQAAMGYKHMAPLQRPHFKKTNADKATKLREAQVAKQKAIAARKGEKKK